MGNNSNTGLTPSQIFERSYNAAQGRTPAIPNVPVSKRNLKPRPKTQVELSRDDQEPYDLTNLGNPNQAPNNNEQQTGIDFNRSSKLSVKNDATKPFKVGLQDVDEAVFYYFNNVIQPFVYQNGGRLPVPVIYASPERWKSAQKDGYYRDKGGSIMLPLIVAQRNSIEKDRSVTAKIDSNSPHLYYSLNKGYNSKNSYNNFDLLNNRKPVHQTQAIVVGDYVTVDYSCIMQTYYMEQLNALVEAMEYASDSYWGDPERFKFRCYIDSFQTEAQLTDGQERLVRGTFNIRLKGQLIPEVLQKDVSALKAYNSSAQVVITQETVHGFDCDGNVIIL